MITVEKPFVIPLTLNGRQAGKTTAPVGSQIEIVAREGDKVQVKFRNLEPVWIESSALGTGDNSGSPVALEQSPSRVVFDPQKAIKALDESNVKALTEIINGRNYPDPAREEEFQASLKEFVEAKAQLESGKRQFPQLEQEAKRLRRNADVADSPNRLNPNDNSGAERAEKLREQADNLEEQGRQTISDAEDQLTEARSSLTSLLEDWEAAEQARREEDELETEQKDEAARLVDEPKKEDGAVKLSDGEEESGEAGERSAISAAEPNDEESDHQPSPNAEEQGATETKPDENKFGVASPQATPISNLSAYRCGPKIHGLQLGMTLSEFEANMKKIVPDYTLEEEVAGIQPHAIGNPTFDPLFESDRTLHEVQFMNRDGYGFAMVSVIGPEQIVVRIMLGFLLVNDIYKAHEMGFKEFCQNMIDGYNIPNFQGTSEGMGYRSKSGWMMAVNSTKNIFLDVTQVEEEVDHGFGE